MNILYLHGWGGSFDENKMKILSMFGDNVEYPNINYQRKNLIGYLCDTYGSKDVLIVGTSLGAYFGFYVSSILKSPALLFNPSFFFKNGGELRPNDANITGFNRDKKFILSSKDELVDFKKTLKFLSSQEYTDFKIYDEGHQIPLDIFEKEFSLFRDKYFKLIDESKKIENEMKRKIESGIKTKYYVSNTSWWDSNTNYTTASGTINTNTNGLWD